MNEINDLWLDLPTSPGLWWVIDSSQEGNSSILEVVREGEKFYVYFLGLEHMRALEELRKSWKWQKAIHPIYYWPGPDHSH